MEYRTHINNEKTPTSVYVVLALARRVLAVAKFNVRVGDWSAYIDAVPGEKHNVEWLAVSQDGSKIPRDVAIALFGGDVERLGRERTEIVEGKPWPDGLYRWRD